MSNHKIGYHVDPVVIQEFNSRYSKGYMTAPRVIEKKRISEVIMSLQLQEEGTALDFGCGKGDFTILLKELLPRWRVLGVDISDVAVKKAREQYTNLEFYTFEDSSALSPGLQVNLIFSHHVLEYVPNIHYVFERLKSLAHAECIMLHIVPCNNGCGLEYKIASKVNQGINRGSGLYFFEHAAHVVRFSEEKFAAVAAQFGYALKRIWYVDQYWGAIEWITRSNLDFIKLITPLNSVISKGALASLFFFRLLFLLLFFVRYPVYNLSKAERKKDWGLLRRGFYFSCMILYYPSNVLNRLLLLFVDQEWRSHKHDKCGGKMYLLVAH